MHFEAKRVAKRQIMVLVTFFSEDFVPKEPAGHVIGQRQIGRFIGQNHVVVHQPEQPMYATDRRDTFPAEALRYE